MPDSLWLANGRVHLFVYSELNDQSEVMINDVYCRHETVGLAVCKKPEYGHPECMLCMLGLFFVHFACP